MPSQGTLSARHNTGNKLVNIRKSALPEPCDAVYQVAGNGMAPIIRDGDLILVAFEKHLEPGAIGAFLCNGQIILRQFLSEILRRERIRCCFECECRDESRYFLPNQKPRPAK